eukprot:15449708-Alexandrium_andersonii.AAC.1
MVARLAFARELIDVRPSGSIEPLMECSGRPLALGGSAVCRLSLRGCVVGWAVKRTGGQLARWAHSQEGSRLAGWM